MFPDISMSYRIIILTSSFLIKMRQLVSGLYIYNQEVSTPFPLGQVHSHWLMGYNFQFIVNVEFSIPPTFFAKNEFQTGKITCFTLHKQHLV